MTPFAKNLREARQRRHLSVAEAARLCGVGRTTWHAYEAGTATPTLAKLAAIAHALQTTASKLTIGLEADTSGPTVP